MNCFFFLQLKCRAIIHACRIMVGEKNGTDIQIQKLRDNLLSQTDPLYVKRTCVIWEWFPLENGKKKTEK